MVCKKNVVGFALPVLCCAAAIIKAFQGDWLGCIVFFLVLVNLLFEKTRIDLINSEVLSIIENKHKLRSVIARIAARHIYDWDIYQTVIRKVLK
jgi:hypothetical protein